MKPPIARFFWIAVGIALCSMAIQDEDSMANKIGWAGMVLTMLDLALLISYNGNIPNAAIDAEDCAPHQWKYDTDGQVIRCEKCGTVAK